MMPKFSSSCGCPANATVCLAPHMPDTQTRPVWKCTTTERLQRPPNRPKQPSKPSRAVLHRPDSAVFRGINLLSARVRVRSPLCTGEEGIVHGGGEGQPLSLDAEDPLIKFCN